MIITNLFRGPPLPFSFIGLIGKYTTTYIDIHKKVGKNYTWVHIPQKDSWIGFHLNGLNIGNSAIPENLVNNTSCGEANFSELHNTQLHSALLKSLVAQTIGINNFDVDIYPTNNLDFFKGIQVDLKFVILGENTKRFLFLRIDTKDTSRRLDTGEGLLNTEERFNQIREVVNYYWPEGINFTLGGHKFEFESDFF